MDTSTINFYKGNHKYEVSADELATEIAQCLQIENLNFLIGAGWIINSEDNIHYFNNFVERVLPTQDEEQREEIEIKKSLKKLAVVLGDSSEDPK